MLLQDAKGRWTLKSPPATLHSMTQPLSATDTLSSSVRITSRNPTGDQGNLNPVVALHSYVSSMVGGTEVVNQGKA